MKRYIVLLCLLIIMGIARANIIGESYISDFGTRADLTSKIWSIDVTTNGYAYFGAQDGMYQFDGSRWTRYSVDGETEVRSVNVSQKSRRIYAGSINEFGYFQPEPSGILRYHSVAKEHGLGPDCGNIWGIFEIGDNLIAQGDYRIYVVNMKTHTPLKIEVGCKVNQSGQVGNMVYFSTEKDLQVLSGTKVRHVEIGGKINPDEIRAICDYGGSPLIITQRQGVWRLSSEGLVSEPYSSAAAAAMGDIFTGAVCNQSIALGSINNGVSIVNAMNGETEHYDEHNGLNNNTVLALSFDSWGALWTGLDRGAQRVLTGFPIRDAGSLAKKVGACYAAIFHNGYLYLGTNRGLFYKKAANLGEAMTSATPYQCIPGSAGQVWALDIVDGTLFCCHDLGLYEVNAATIKPVEGVKGSWHCVPADLSGEALLATYAGYYKLQRGASGWSVSGKLKGYDASAYNFVLQSRDTFWEAEGNNGVLKVNFNPATLQVRQVEMYRKATDGYAIKKNVCIVKAANKVWFCTDNGLYSYNAREGKIEPEKAINRHLCSQTTVRNVKYNGETLLVLTDKELLIIGKDNECISRQSVAQLDIPKPNGAELLNLADSTHLLIPHYDGLAILDLQQIEATPVASKPMSSLVREVSLPSAGDSIVYRSNFLNEKPTPELSYAHNGVRIRYGADVLSSTGVVGYQYSLDDDPWSVMAGADIREFTNLHEGEHIFKVRATMADGTVVEDSFSFRVLPPWYRSLPAMIVYFLLLGVMIWQLILFEKRRVARKQKAVEAVKNEELRRQQEQFAREAQEKDRQIMELERQRLSNELEHKSQEMASVLVNLAHKTDTLEDLKRGLAKLSTSQDTHSENVKSIKEMQSNIDNTLHAEQLMERFQKEFDLVHNDFLKTIKERYPDLNAGEVRMCAYLKMNLSTKEIATLMRISVRGVETIRYRLRRKLGLERSENLLVFLNSVFEEYKNQTR